MTADVSPLKKYGVLLWSVAGLVILAWQQALAGDGRVDLDEGLVLGTVGLQGLLTYVVPQTPRFPKAKNVISGLLGLLALGGAFYMGLVDGFSQQEVATIVITALTAAGALLPGVSDNGTGGGLGADRRNPVVIDGETVPAAAGRRT
jgi:hypothetical protein